MSQAQGVVRRVGVVGRSKRGFGVVFGVAVATAAQLWGGSAVRADDQYFDADGVGTVQSGPGLWDNISNRWAPTPTSTAPFNPFTFDANAHFTGAGGLVLVNDTIATEGIFVSGADTAFFNSGTGTLLLGLNGPGTVNVDAGHSVTFNTSVTGSAGLTKTGAGTLSFTKVLIGGGDVNINEGTLRYAASAADVLTSRINIASGAVLDMSIINDTFGSLSGVAGSTVKLGTLPLGITTGSRIAVGSDNTDSVFAGSIQGAGGRFDKQGAGNMTLSGANTFTGFVTVSGGTLRVENGQALGDTAPVFIGNATNVNLDLGHDEAIGSLGGAGDTGGNVNVNGFKLTLGGDNLANNYLGTISGDGTIVKTGTGIQIINSTSTNTAASPFTGKYVVQSGTLAFRADNRLGADPATNVNDYITLSGGELSNTGFGGTTLGTHKGITITADSTITALGSVASNLVIGSQGGAPITGSNSITKRGQGILTVDSDNSTTFSGKWIIKDGTLKTNRGISTPLGTCGYDISGGTLSLTPGGSGTNVDYALANAAADTTFAYGPGAILNVNRGTNAQFRATFGNAGAAANSVLVRNGQGTLVITAAGGAANLGNTAAGEAILFNGGVALADNLIPGAIATTSLSQVPAAAAQTAGDFVSYGPNGVVKATYTSGDVTTAGATDVVQQNLPAVLLADTSVAALKVGDGTLAGQVDTGGHTLTVGNGTAPGMVILNAGANITGNAGKLDFRGSQGVIYTQQGPNTIGPAITGSGGLSKVGPGQLTLVSFANYTGPTDISQGTLTLTVSNQLPVTTKLALNGNATLDLATANVSQEVASLNAENLPAVSGTGGSSIAFGNDSVLKISGAGDMVYRGGSTTPAGQGTSTVWKAGPGTLTLGVPQSISTFGGAIASPSMSYDKLWVTGGGTVALSSGNSIPDGFTGSPLPDAYMLDGGTIRFNTLTTTSLAAAGASFISVSGGTRGMTIGPNGGTIDVPSPYEIVIFQVSNTTAANLIHGSGVITKIGPGFFRPGPGNDFTGRWVIKEGNLQFQDDSALGTPPATFTANALEIDGGIIQGNGFGNIDKNRGVLIGPNNAIMTNGPFFFNGAVSGPGTITRLGGGTVSGQIVFNAPSTYGGINIVQGIVDFNASDSAGSGTVNLDPKAYVAIGKNEGPDSTISNAIVLGGAGSPIDIRVASDISPVIGSNFEGMQTGSLTLAGKISGPGMLYKGLGSLDQYTPSNGGSVVNRNNDGTVILTNSGNDFTNTFNIMLGTAVAGANNALGATNGATFVAPGATLAFANVNYTAAEPVYASGTGVAGLGAIQNLSGTSRFAGPVAMNADTTFGVAAGSSLELAGALTGDAAVTKVGGGTLSLSNTTNHWTGDTTVQEGTLEFAADHRIGKLVLQTNTTARLSAGNKLLRTTDVQFNDPANPDAKLDLNDGRLIVDYTDASKLPIVRGQIISAYGGGGNWSGNGITSSAAQANSKLAVGYAEASEVASGGTWTGEPVDTTAVLVRTTLAGDATLDGTV
ncbi:MAG TPA: autotransporter-associated beta strand repeat-containing protein, partial [Tepidisphaeraceae bacterium]